ncbi:hypothetical protein BJ742DRAFT_780175 [Cladochytrium replicatum]|nr:hypothetical protein BJ742DRAFT_780175 [Cladochytrium replicatum]
MRQEPEKEQPQQLAPCLTDLGVRQTAQAVRTAFSHSRELRCRSSRPVWRSRMMGTMRRGSWRERRDTQGGLAEQERDDEMEVGPRDAQMITTEEELRQFVQGRHSVTPNPGLDSVSRYIPLGLTTTRFNDHTIVAARGRSYHRCCPRWEGSRFDSALANSQLYLSILTEMALKVIRHDEQINFEV